jgi:prepilin-type N-terminal cleavage/methylation domain-containing protein
MKRNGFTLVEMMAVIVLVALLAVIGVATYTNVNESAKEKTLESKKEQIRSSA